MLIYKVQIQEFISISDEAKQGIVFKYGLFLENNGEGNVACDVYKLFEFYVVFCHVLDKQGKPVIIANYKKDHLPFARTSLLV